MFCAQCIMVVMYHYVYNVSLLLLFRMVYYWTRTHFSRDSRQLFIISGSFTPPLSVRPSKELVHTVWWQYPPLREFISFYGCCSRNVASSSEVPKFYSYRLILCICKSKLMKIHISKSKIELSKTLISLF